MFWSLFNYGVEAPNWHRWSLPSQWWEGFAWFEVKMLGYLRLRPVSHNPVLTKGLFWMRYEQTYCIFIGLLKTLGPFVSPINCTKIVFFSSFTVFCVFYIDSRSFLGLLCDWFECLKLYVSRQLATRLWGSVFFHCAIENIRAKAFESEVRLLYGDVLLNEGMELRVGVGDGYGVCIICHIVY